MNHITIRISEAIIVWSLIIVRLVKRKARTVMTFSINISEHTHEERGLLPPVSELPASWLAELKREQK